MPAEDHSIPTDFYTHDDCGYIEYHALPGLMPERCPCGGKSKPRRMDTYEVLTMLRSVRKEKVVDIRVPPVPKAQVTPPSPVVPPPPLVNNQGVRVPPLPPKGAMF